MNPLGADLRLFRSPQAETEIDHIAAPKNVPDPLRIREFALQVRAATATMRRSEGERRLRRRPQRGAVARRRGSSRCARRAPRRPAIPTRCSWCASPICAMCSTAAATSSAGPTKTTSGRSSIALDPERGRVLLGADRVADHASEPFTATFHYGFSRDIGGGDYERTPAEAAAGGLELTRERRADSCSRCSIRLEVSGGRLLIEDSLTYTESPTFKAPADYGPRTARCRGRRQQWRAPADRRQRTDAAADRRERHAGARRPGDLRRRAAPARRGGQ